MLTDTKNRSHTIISLDVEKALNKAQYSFMVKDLETMNRQNILNVEDYKKDQMLTLN